MDENLLDLVQRVIEVSGRLKTATDYAESIEIDTEAISTSDYRIILSNKAGV